MSIAFVDPIVCRNLRNETGRNRAAVAAEQPLDQVLLREVLDPQQLYLRG